MCPKHLYLKHFELYYIIISKSTILTFGCQIQSTPEYCAAKVTIFSELANNSAIILFPFNHYIVYNREMTDRLLGYQ